MHMRRLGKSTQIELAELALTTEPSKHFKKYIMRYSLKKNFEKEMPRNCAKVDYSRPTGAPAYLYPGSVQWRIFKNQLAVGIGGIAAVLLEFADPRIRSGVWDNSIYSTDPVRRAERTGIALSVGIYGSQADVRRLIARITRMPMNMSGKTLGGRHYSATDPELLNWVNATSVYAFLSAYDRFVSPVSETDKRRYWNDEHDIAALYGADIMPRSEADFLAMMNVLAPGFEARTR